MFDYRCGSGDISRHGDVSSSTSRNQPVKVWSIHLPQQQKGKKIHQHRKRRRRNKKGTPKEKTFFMQIRNFRWTIIWNSFPGTWCNIYCLFGIWRRPDTDSVGLLVIELQKEKRCDFTEDIYPCDLLTPKRLPRSCRRWFFFFFCVPWPCRSC